MSAQPPVIDITGLCENEAGAVERVAANLAAPCGDWGCFHVVGHGISPAELAGFDAAMRAFFDLPAAAKESVRRTRDNAWGFYEMHGNVWEWCHDWYKSDLTAEPVVDPQGPASGGDRVLRGGSWYNYGRYCRSAYRFRYHPSYRHDNIGFRLARGH